MDPCDLKLVHDYGKIQLLPEECSIQLSDLQQNLSLLKSLSPYVLLEDCRPTVLPSCFIVGRATDEDVTQLADTSSSPVSTPLPIQSSPSQQNVNFVQLLCNSNSRKADRTKSSGSSSSTIQSEPSLTQPSQSSGEVTSAEPLGKLQSSSFTQLPDVKSEPQDYSTAAVEKPVANPEPIYLKQLHQNTAGFVEDSTVSQLTEVFKTEAIEQIARCKYESFVECPNLPGDTIGEIDFAAKQELKQAALTKYELSKQDEIVCSPPNYENDQNKAVDLPLPGQASDSSEQSTPSSDSEFSETSSIDSSDSDRTEFYLSTDYEYEESEHSPNLPFKSSVPSDLLSKSSVPSDLQSQSKYQSNLPSEHMFEHPPERQSGVLLLRQASQVEYMQSLPLDGVKSEPPTDISLEVFPASKRKSSQWKTIDLPSLENCIFCSEKFSSKERTRKHMDESHSNGCLSCRTEFNSVHLLMQHLIKQHKSQDGYKCPFCTKIMNACEPFHRHCRSHMHLPPWQCQLCSEFTETRVAMWRHLRDHHKQYSTVQLLCQICQNHRTGNSAMYLEHYTNDCRIIVCYYKDCGYRTGSYHKLTHHIVQCHDKQEGVQCTVQGCGFTAVSSRGLKRHCNDVHSSKKAKIRYKNELSSAPTAVLSVSKQDSRTCKYIDCAQLFPSTSELENHVKVHHKKCGTGHSKEGWYAAATYWKKMCNLCGKLFRDKTEQSRHMVAHHSTDKHRCDRLCKCQWPTCFTCGAKHTKPKRMVLHWRKSEKCKPTREQKVKYAYHMAKDDVREKRKSLVRASDLYTCPVAACSYTTHSDKHFSRHLFFHWKSNEPLPTGQLIRYVRCPLCAHTCCDPSKLRRHLRIHTGQVPAKSFIVDYITHTT